jgi:threonine dehydrogenase-like Zn-dependent dehydrogenase
MDAEGRELTIHSVRITQRHRLVAITNLQRAFCQAYYQEIPLKPSLGVLPYFCQPRPSRRITDNILMKAIAVYPADRRLSVIDHPEPAVTSPDEVKLRMLDVGICGTDKEIVSFEYGTPPEGSPYLIIGHESLGEVIEAGSAVTRVKVGELAVPTVRRPCSDPACIACRADRQDFCYSGKFTERGINQRHGYMTEFVVEQERYLNPVPRALRDVAVLVEPLTIAEKGIAQLKLIQERLPWREQSSRAVVLGGGPVGLLGAMKLVLEGCDTTVYSRTPEASDLENLVTSFGAKFVHAETTSIADLAKQVGSIDIVYEAVGASSLAFEVIPFLGTNGVFIFTGVPGRKSQILIDTDTIMRDAVLKNQLIFGTVNASTESFADAIADIGSFLAKWPAALRSLITRRWPLDQAAEPLAGKSGGIKNVIAIAN